MDYKEVLKEEITLLKDLGLFKKKFKRSKEFIIPITRSDFILLISVQPMGKSFEITDINQVKKTLDLPEEEKKGLRTKKKLKIGDKFPILNYNKGNYRRLIYKKVHDDFAMLSSIKKFKKPKEKAKE